MEKEIREKIALKRYQIISPVLAEPGRVKNQYFREQAKKEHEFPRYGVRKVKVSTMKAWLRNYRKNGFEGLKPQGRSDGGRPRRMSDQMLASVEVKCKAYPHWTVQKLYEELREQALLGAPPVHYNTLLRIVKTKGWLTPKTRIDVHKAYEVDNFGDLWLCDFMHGPQVRIGNQTRKAILCAIMDDHTRMIVGHAFSGSETISALTHVLKEALSTYGVVQRLYVDNVNLHIINAQSFGDFPERFHPHLHILATDGAFYLSACGHAQADGNGLFRVASRFPLKALERIFRHRVLRMLLDKGRISPETIRIMDHWRHSGFNVYCGPRILPRQKKSLERLAAYRIRSSFSQDRMKYLPEDAKVRFRAKDGKQEKAYDALDWLAAMGAHVPSRGQQSVRYYGFLSNAARGRRRKQQQEGQDPLPTVLVPQAANGLGKNSAWARLIQKVYETDPLACPRCGAAMKVISFINDPVVIRKILEHLGLWLANARPVPKAHSPPGPYSSPDAYFSQLPPAYENEFSQLPPEQWEF